MENRDLVARTVSDFCSELLQEFVAESLSEGRHEWAEADAVIEELSKCEPALTRQADREEAKKTIGRAIICCMKYIGDTAAKPIMTSRSEQYRSLLHVSFVEELFKEIINNPGIALETYYVPDDEIVAWAKDLLRGEGVQGCYLMARLLMCVYAEKVVNGG